MEKGVQKAEGLWRHLKHGSFAIPEEVRADDARLDMYCHSLVWRFQNCGCPYRDTLRMCRAFRNLPLADKAYVFNHGVKDPQTKQLCHDKPPVTYCRWSLNAPEEDGTE